MTEMHKQTNRLGHKMLAALLTVVLIFVMLPSASAAELSGYGDTSVVNIINNGSGKYLNVGLGYDTNGNNIYQYTNDSSVEQKFRLRYDTVNEYYYIAAMCSSNGYDKGLSAVSTSSTSNVQLYTISSSSVLQRWVFVYVGNGLYTISPYANRSLYLTAHNGSNGSRSRTATSGSNASGNVYVTTMNGTDETGDPTYGQYQLWRINSLVQARRAEQGYYRIKNVKSGMYISRDSSNNISQQRESDDYMQTWFIRDVGTWHLITSGDNKAYGLSMLSSTNGASFTYDDSIGTNFNIIKNAGEETYRIATEYSSYGYVTTVYLGSESEGAEFVQTTYTGATSQKWELIPIRTFGELYIESLQNGKLLSVDPDDQANGYLTENASVKLSIASGENNQKWLVTALSDGTSKIISVASGKALTASDSVPSTSSSLVQREYTGADNQRWYILKIYDRWIIKDAASMVMLARDGASDVKILSVPYYEEMTSTAYWTLNRVGGSRQVVAISPPDYEALADPTVEGYDSESFFENATAFANAVGYASRSYDGKTGNHILTEMISSEVCLVMAHGSSKTVKVTSTLSISDTDLLNLADGAFSGSKLVMYMTCSAGAPVSSGMNIVQATYDRGAKCVLGWNCNTNIREGGVWCEYFFNYLGEGYAIYDAAAGACLNINMEEIYIGQNVAQSMTIETLVLLGDSTTVF